LRVVETPRSHLWRLVALGLPLALVALAAMLPPDLVPQFRWPTGAPISDKVLHVLGFAALGCVFGLLFQRVLSGMIGVLLFGLAIEVAQAWAGLGRQGDPQDALANLLGLVVAFVVIGCWRALWSLQPSPPPAAQP
jgi:VanZ family protein